MQVVVNELSTMFPVDSVVKAKETMETLLAVYRRYIHLGLQRVVLSESSLVGTLLAEDYPVEKWRNDNSVDVELRRMFATFNDKMEFVDKHNYLAEFQCELGSSVGCLVAHETENVLISFNSHPNWNVPCISGKIVRLGDGGLVEQEAVVLNAATLENINDIENEIIQTLSNQKYVNITYQKIWYERESLFPNLIFCPRVQTQLDQLQVTYLNQIVKKLEILNRYFEQWDGKFDKSQLPNVDPESVETLSRFSREHTFRLPDGRELLFSFHIRFTGNYEGRIYFVPDNITGKGVIGHIDGKLPTVNFPNPS